MNQSGAMAKWQSCPVTSSTTQWALVTTDGRIYRLDDPAAFQTFRTGNRWTSAMDANRPTHVTVRGTLEGDTLHIESIK